VWENVLKAWLDVRWLPVQVATSLGNRRYCYRGGDSREENGHGSGKPHERGPAQPGKPPWLSFLRLSACTLSL